MTGIKSHHCFVPLAGNAILMNGLSCFCSPCFKRDFLNCETRHIRPESKRISIVVNVHQTGETIRSLRILCKRGWELTKGAQAGDLFVLYVAKADRGCAGLGEGQITAEGRFIIAELAEKIGDRSWTGSTYRGSALVKWFYAKEEKAESEYIFEDMRKCNVLGSDKEGKGVLVPYSKCGPKGPEGPCYKKHYEEVSIQYVLEPGKLVRKEHYNVKEKRGRGKGGGTVRIITLKASNRS